MKTLCKLLFLVLLASALPVSASTSWTGLASTNWSDAANWTAGVPLSTVDAVIGDTNFTGLNQPSLIGSSACKSLTLGNGTKNSTLTVGFALVVSGDITIGAQGTLAHIVTTAISLTGNWNNSGTYAPTKTGSTVTFNGVTQTIGGSVVTPFRKMTIAVSSTTKLVVNATVSNLMTVSGTVDFNEPTTYSVTGAGKLTVNAKGKVLIKAATFSANCGLTGTITLNATSTIDYASTNINQTISSSLTYGTLKVSGDGTKTLAGNLPALNSTTAAAGDITVAAGTLDLAGFTANRGTTVAGGTVSVANGSILKIGSTTTFPANYATRSFTLTSTVEYNGTTQTVSAESYGNLTLSSASGAAVKIMPTNAMTISGNFSSTIGAGTSVSYTAGAAITFLGNVTIGTGTTFNGSTFSHTAGANWTNSGTFAGSTSTITFNGAGAIIAGSGSQNFNNLTLANSGITAVANTDLTVGGNLATTGSGTFTHTAGSTGTVTMSGTSQTISGTGIVFNHLTASGSISTAGSFTVVGNMSVSGSFSASAGTITLSGTSKTIGGGGTTSFKALNITGSISTMNSISISSDVSVAGTLTASAGTVTFNGSSILSGAVNLNNVTLNGTKLQLGSSSILGIAGALTLTSGTFDVTTTTPNTVNYNGAAQAVTSATYHHLIFSGSGTKTAGGALTVGGDLTIGSGTTLSGGSATHSVNGNWVNNGSFSAGTSTVQLAGASDMTVTGATAFNILTLAKNTFANSVVLNNNVNVGTLNMTTGSMKTGTNTVTITSTRTGNGTILGTITRTHSFTSGTSYAFEGPNNTVKFTSIGTVSSVTVAVASGTISDFPFGDSMNRQYTISVINVGSYVATLRLHYEDAELAGNDESSMTLWRYGGTWSSAGKSSNDTGNNWVEQTSLSNLNDRWTLSDSTSTVQWNGSVSSAWETAANWTITQGTPSRPPSSSDVVELGSTNFINQPTITSAASVKKILFGSAQAVTLTVGSGGSLNTAGNINGTWAASATHTIAVGNQALTVNSDLTLSDGTSGHAINLTVGSGSVTVAGTLIEAGAANVTFSGAGALNVGGNFNYTNGTFTAGSSTVTYNGNDVQAVAGVTYNQLAFNKAAGSATLASSATVNGHLMLTNSGTFLVNAALTVVSNVTIYSNTTMNGGSSTISVGGNWSQSGTFTPGTGTVIFNSTNSQSIGATTFNNLTINKSANSATLTGNLTLNGDLNFSAGTLDMATSTVIRSSVGGTLTMATNVTLRLGNGSGFPSNFGVNTMASTSTVEYYGTTAQNIQAQVYGRLLLSNGGSNPKTLMSATTVGDLIISSGATLNASNANFTLQGNWTNSGSFVASNSTVILAGSGKFVSGNTTFNHLTVPGSYIVDGSNVNIAGNFNISGIFDAGPGTITIDGDLTNTGSLASSGIANFSGTRVQTFRLLNALQSVSTGVVNFNGTTAFVALSTSSPQFANVNIYNTSGSSPAMPWTVFGTMYIAPGASFDGRNLTHTFRGAFTNSGTMTSSGTLQFLPLAAKTLVLGAGLTSSGTVLFGSANQITLAGASPTFSSVVIANTHAAGITPATNWNLSDDLIINSGATFHGGTGLAHSVTGDIIADGTFDGQTSTVTLNGVSNLGGSGNLSFYHLIVTGTITALSDFNVFGNFTDNGTFDGTDIDVTLAGTAASTISGSTTPVPIDSLIISKTAATAMLAVKLTVTSDLTINSGTLDASTFAIANGGSAVLAVNSGGTLKFGGTNTLPSFTTYTFDPASTVEYAGSGSQNIAAQNYGNLTSTGAGARVLASSGTIGVSGTFTPGTNSYTKTGSTIAFNGTATQTIPAFSYNHLTSSSSGIRTLTPSGSINIAGTFTPGVNTYVGTNSTVNFNGTTQTIPAFTFYNLTVSGSGTKTLGGNITANGALNLSAGTLADGGFVATVNGDVSNNATHSGSGKILLAPGSGSRLLSGTGSYNNLDLNDANGAALSLADLTVNGTLTLTAGKFTTATNKIIMGTNAVVSRTAGYVIGFLQKNVATGTNVSRTFEVGTTNGYDPVSLTVSNVSVAGNLTAIANPGDQPSISSSTLQPSYSANVYWSLGKSVSLAFNAYNAVFTFVNPSDLDSGINPLFFKVGNYVSSAWNYPQVGTRATRSTEVIGVTSLGDFALAGNVNSAPTLGPISNVSVNEDASLQTVNLSGISAGPSDESGQIITITAFSSNEGLIHAPTVNYTNAAITGSLNFSTVANEIGTCTITVIVQDNGGTLGGGVDSVTNTFTVTVNAVNDAPSFTEGPNIFIATNAGPQTITNWATQISSGPSTNESGQVVDFIVSNDSTNLFSVQPTVSANGTLTFTPAGGVGLALVSVQLHDNGGTNNGGQNLSGIEVFAIGIGVGGFVPATGGEAISADDALIQTNWTTLTGPKYYEGTSGDLGVGDIILTAPAGFEFDTNIVSGQVVGLLVSTIASTGTNSANINGVTNGAFIPLVVTRSNVTFTITSPSTNGAVDYVELKHLRVRPTDTNLITQDILDTGTAASNTSFGTLAEVAGAAAKLSIDTQPSSAATAGIDFLQQPVVRIEDQFGHLITDDNVSQVTATRLAGSGILQGTTTLTASKGLVTFVNLSHDVATNITINFTGGSLTNVISDPIAVGPGAAYRLAIQTQPSTTATAGVIFASQPVIRIEDPFGNLVASDNSTTITATRALGSGTLRGTTTVTASGGLITFGDLSHNSATTITINFTSGNLIDATSGSILVSPSAATQLTLLTQPSPTATAGVIFTVQPVIRIRDAQGNLVTNDNSSVVTATRLDGSGTLQGTTTATASGGLATFTNLSHNAATNITINFSSGSLTNAVSASIDVSPAAAYRLAMQTQPSAVATAGVSFAVQPVIRIEDSLGNLVRGDNSTLVTVTRLGGSGTLHGTTTAAALGGLVTFADLSHNVATTITVDFTTSGLNDVVSASIAIGAASIAQLAFTHQPSSTIAGKVFSTQPIIEALDEFGNPTTTIPANLDVTIALSSGTGLMFGQKTFDIGSAAGNGLVTFTNLEINTAGNKQLTASGPGLTNAVSGVFMNVGTVQRYESAGDYAVGLSPQGICLGNFRGTGDFRDMAVPNYADNTVTVRKCNDDGTFDEASTFGTDLNPIATGFADMNRDHLDDFVVANYGSNTVSVFINEKPTFLPGESYPVGPGNPGPIDLAFGDWNGDGRVDVFVANALSNNVSVLLGLGNGVLGPFTNYSVGVHPNSIALADLNSDGIADILTANSGDNTLSILHGNSAHTFDSAQTITLFPGGNPQPKKAIVTDVNHDGIPDIITVNYGSNNVSIFLGDTNGNFDWSTNYDVGTKPVTVWLRDIDNDGRSDLVVVNSGSGTVDILLNQADGTYVSGGTAPVGAGPVAISESNFNSDHFTDLAVANADANTVSILLYSGPIAVGSTINVLEDEATPIQLVGRSLHPTTLSYSIGQQPTNGVLSIIGQSNVVYTPNTNFYGIDSFKFSVSDGSITSALATVTLNVLPVNDAPSFTLPTSEVFVVGNAPTQTNVNFATGMNTGQNESGQTLTFVVTTTNAAFFSVQPKISSLGTLTFRSATGAIGTNTMTVRLVDSGGITRGTNQSSPLTFRIICTNVPPVITVQPSNWQRHPGK